MRALLFAALAAGVLARSAPAAEVRQPPDTTPNPGGLSMSTHLPDGLPPGSPLVVALHGCTQSAAVFGRASGWVELADRHRFALLLPQQEPANNADLCFNFFREEDNWRGQGEAASIEAMVDAMVADHGLDPARVFVTGLSAGGGMTAVMLAAYPEVFAGGAVLAGVAYGCAGTAGQPFLAAQKQWFLWTNPFGEAGWAAYACGISRADALPVRLTPFDRRPPDWGGLVRDAGAPAPGRWPRVSLWQGGDDRTVHPANLQELVDQWTAVHGVDQVADAEETTPGYRRRAFADAGGTVRVEAFELPGLGHAVPVDPGAGAGQCGTAADEHFVDKDVCAALVIARFWGLVGAP